MENYKMNYDPNDIATNAPDFEEPHVENNHVAHFNGDPMQDEAYRRYYEELKNSQKDILQAEGKVIKARNHENLNSQSEKPVEISKNNKISSIFKKTEFLVHCRLNIGI